jgi:hypothetical protein
VFHVCSRTSRLLSRKEIVEPSTKSQFGHVCVVRGERAAITKYNTSATCANWSSNVNRDSVSCSQQLSHVEVKVWELRRHRLFTSTPL